MDRPFRGGSKPQAALRAAAKREKHPAVRHLHQSAGPLHFSRFFRIIHTYRKDGKIFLNDKL